MTSYLTAADLGIHVRADDESSLFKWLLASFLFGKRIGQNIAAGTWRVLVEAHGLDTPAKVCRCTHAQLVRMLGEGGYARYDHSTADRLSLLCGALVLQYQGGVLGMAEAAGCREAFEHRLRQFKGIGPVTVGIFMREAGPVLFPD